MNDCELAQSTTTSSSSCYYRKQQSPRRIRQRGEGLPLQHHGHDYLDYKLQYQQQKQQEQQPNQDVVGEHEATMIACSSSISKQIEQGCKRIETKAFCANGCRLYYSTTIDWCEIITWILLFISMIVTVSTYKFLLQEEYQLQHQQEVQQIIEQQKIINNRHRRLMEQQNQYMEAVQLLQSRFNSQWDLHTEVAQNLASTITAATLSSHESSIDSNWPFISIPFFNLQAAFARAQIDSDFIGLSPLFMFTNNQTTTTTTTPLETLVQHLSAASSSSLSGHDQSEDGESYSSMSALDEEFDYDSQNAYTSHLIRQLREEVSVQAGSTSTNTTSNTTTFSYAPLWQVSPPSILQSFWNYNLLSHPYLQKLVPKINKASQFGLSDYLLFGDDGNYSLTLPGTIADEHYETGKRNRNSHNSIMIWPIFNATTSSQLREVERMSHAENDDHDQDHIMNGFVTIMISWDRIMSEVLFGESTTDAATSSGADEHWSDLEDSNLSLRRSISSIVVSNSCNNKTAITYQFWDENNSNNDENDMGGYYYYVDDNEDDIMGSARKLVSKVGDHHDQQYDPFKVVVRSATTTTNNNAANDNPQTSSQNNLENVGCEYLLTIYPSHDVVREQLEDATTKSPHTVSSIDHYDGHSAISIHNIYIFTVVLCLFVIMTQFQIVPFNNRNSTTVCNNFKSNSGTIPPSATTTDKVAMTKKAPAVTTSKESIYQKCISLFFCSGRSCTSDIASILTTPTDIEDPELAYTFSDDDDLDY